MEKLFFTILDMSLSASWIVLAVLMLRMLLRKSSRWVHCTLWALVAVRLLCPVSPESSWSLMPRFHQEVLTAAITDNPREILFAESHSVETVPENVMGSMESHIYGVTTASDGTVIRTGEVTPIPSSDHWLPVLYTIWLSGVMIMLLCAAGSYGRIRKKVSVSIELGNGVYLCDYVDSPFILGIRKPKIYLPSDMDPADAPLILAHERAHLHRRDHWWKPLGYLLLCLHWFNPLLWAAYILLCQDIELACDERVIRHLDSCEKKQYSQALLKRSVPRHLILACPLAFGEVGVNQRIKSILNYKKPGFWILLVSILSLVLAAVCFLTDPERDTLSDFYEGNRSDVTCVDLMTEKGHTCLNSPAELEAVWELLDAVEYDPHPHTTEEVWDTMIDEFYTYPELEFNIGEELHTLYFYRDYSSICAEDTQGHLQHYAVSDPAAVKTFFSTYIDVFSWYKVTAEPFATAQQPYQWMQNVTLDALSDVRTAQSVTSHYIQGAQFSPARAAEFIKVLQQIPEDALTGPETIHAGSVDLIKRILINDPNLIVSFQDGANDLQVFLRYYIRFGETHLEIVMVDGVETEATRHQSIQSALKWDIDSELLLSAMLELQAHPPSVTAFVGAEYTWQDAPLKVSGGGISLSLRMIQGWQSEIIPYQNGCESFGIRVRPAGISEGWVYFSFWPGGYTPEEYNRTYMPQQQIFQGYTSYPATYAWYYGTGHESFLWSYQCFPVNIGTYAIINDGADSWLLEYADPIRDIQTFFTMEGGIQESFSLPDPNPTAVDYPQSNQEQHGFKRFQMETRDPANLSVNSAWIYEDNVVRYEDHIHFGSFWPEYITEGRVCIEYWDGFFQPDESILVEPTTIFHYGGFYEGFSGKVSGDSRYTYLWLNRDHGSYVFRFENTQSWTDFQIQCVIDHVIAEISFRQA